MLSFACITQYEFIVVSGQTMTSAFHKVVSQQYFDEVGQTADIYVKLQYYLPRIIKVGQCFTELGYLKNWHSFFDTRQ